MSGERQLHIALLCPEIPGNTGNIGRLALGLGARLHLVHPLGFETTEKAARRAGIDHWAHVDRQEHANEADFFSWTAGRRVHLFSTHGTACFTLVDFQPGDVLLFGCESVGLPSRLVMEHGAWRIPLEGRVRSLNLSNAVAVVSYEALRQIQPTLFQQAPFQQAPFQPAPGEGDP